MKTSNTKKGALITSVAIVSLIVGSFLLAGLSFNKSEAVNTTVQKISSPKVIDSIITAKIDYRFTSYDHKFIYTNTVVVNDAGEIIGKLIIQTNNKALDSFYNGSGKMKTRTYKNIREGVFNISQDSIATDN